MDDSELFTKPKAEVDTLLNTSNVFSHEAEMQFRLAKCATLMIKDGNSVEVNYS